MQLQDQLKRAIWILNEIINASSFGISLNELDRKWGNSRLNETKENGIPERTFLRIRRIIESVFDIEIECTKDLEKGDNLYRLSQEYLEPGNNSVYGLLMNKLVSGDKNNPPLNEIWQLLITGTEVPQDALETIKSISKRLRGIPREYAIKLTNEIEREKVKRADRVAIDEDYSDYTCVWNQKDYLNNDLWLSIGFLENEILFYIVTSNQDKNFRDRLCKEIGLNNGERYKQNYWWFEPKDDQLFRQEYETFPNMEGIINNIEILLDKISKFEK